MFLSPEVAIVQHSTGVMQVAWDYFENGITFFTNMVYTAIRFSIGSGEVAPFVGHNAFIRWAAVQDVGGDAVDGYISYWSESHVSEDFDIALRMQIKGSIVRIASYHGDGFKEGVSLTIVSPTKLTLRSLSARLREAPSITKTHMSRLLTLIATTV